LAIPVQIEWQRKLGSLHVTKGISMTQKNCVFYLFTYLFILVSSDILTTQ